MPAPNSYNFVVTRDNVITDALRQLNAIGEGETPSANAVTEAARILNGLLKLRANELPVWSIRRGYLLPTTETSSVNTNSHVVSVYETTTIGADEASSQTVITVADSTNMAADDNIGIEMDDGTMHWTTIVSVDDGTTITITDALDDEASSGNYVYWYTASADRIQRPLRILDATIINIASNSSWPITVENRTGYYMLGNRTTYGTPDRIFYDPVLGSKVADPATATTWYGTIYVYPRFYGGDHVVEFNYQEPMQDVDSASDNLYVPQEFYLPIVLELAALLGPRYTISKEERASLFAEAKMYREEALMTIREEGSIYLQPEDR